MYKGYAKLEGVGGQIRCIMGNVEVAYNQNLDSKAYTSLPEPQVKKVVAASL